jgi:hypothetical protein
MIEAITNKLNELARIGRHKIDLISLQRRIEKNFLELGGRVYHLAVEDKQTAILDDIEVINLIDALRKLEGELKSKKQEEKINS